MSRYAEQSRAGAQVLTTAPMAALGVKDTVSWPYSLHTAQLIEGVADTVQSTHHGRMWHWGYRSARTIWPDFYASMTIAQADRQPRRRSVMRCIAQTSGLVAAV